MNQLEHTDHHYALVGEKLSHSFSKAYFDAKFANSKSDGYSYRLLELDSLAGLRQKVQELQLDGFNVTIPYKEQMLHMLDEVDPTTAAIGAANTVKVIRHDNQLMLIGYNTDAPAFLETLRPLLRDWHHKALILGTGGASKAVAWALRQLGIAHRFVSRTPLKHVGQGIDTVAYDEAFQLADSHLLIVNCTPVGMYPHIEESPWKTPAVLTPKHLCYDLIYNPERTRFLLDATERGAATANGLAMLHRQADMAYTIWQA